jgi:carotenoid cleavage dioxygenase-like enzyme
MKNGEPHPVVYETEKLFVFHHANAYEEDGHIVVDVSAYNSADVRLIFQQRIFNILMNFFSSM